MELVGLGPGARSAAAATSAASAGSTASAAATAAAAAAALLSPSPPAVLRVTDCPDMLADSPPVLVDPYLDFLDTLDLDAAVDAGTTQAECEAFGAALQLQQSLLSDRTLATPEATAAVAAGSVARPSADAAADLEMLTAVGDLAMDEGGAGAGSADGARFVASCFAEDGPAGAGVGGGGGTGRPVWAAGRRVGHHQVVRPAGGRRWWWRRWSREVGDRFHCGRRRPPDAVLR
eukprot:TRINITY_DN2027_c1_g1_i1.p2 TRINITY_DN2027_c1_g1~~TRINITY_DN2027_c1_g1_i1.p2  ORF type:complete len:233 (+),score=79.17 TRINITY_DN2027_c1_g1_i1:964-1662(+)